MCSFDNSALEKDESKKRREGLFYYNNNRHLNLFILEIQFVNIPHGS